MSIDEIIDILERNQRGLEKIVKQFGKKAKLYDTYVEEIYALRTSAQELKAIKKILDNLDEFGKLIDLEYDLPSLADRLNVHLAELYRRLDSINFNKQMGINFSGEGNFKI